MRRILITSEQDDNSTDDVMDWLYYYGATPVRLNNNFTIENICLSVNDENVNFTIRNNKVSPISTENIDSYWYRRGSFALGNQLKILDKFDHFLCSYNEREITDVRNALFKIGNDRLNCLNNYTDNFTNKIANLIAAQKVGLKVPPTIVTDNIYDLNKFLELYSEVIIKCIAIPGFTMEDNNFNASFSAGTIAKKSSELKQYLSDVKLTKFQPTLFQQYIPKRYEIRCFYIREKCYSMAIFSQENEKTKKDFRNYDNERPNRTIPFNLPSGISNALINFMKNIDINCGSIDLIVTPSLEFVFLEVNPIGQFQWLSKNCNYFIEKKIAKVLLYGQRDFEQ